MLTHLYIRDFAIVRKLELSLEGGLTVLTGETGAGKSIMIDALALALGERGDSELIRHGCDQAEILAAFDLAPHHDAAAWLEANDLAADQECVLRRLIYREKPTKGFINGRPVPMQMLRDLGASLVDIHGQHEHQSLLRREIQRQTLDDFAGHGPAVERLAELFRQMKGLENRLESLRRESADREARIELLRYQVNELETLNLEPDEVPHLEEEHARLAHASELVEGIQTVAGNLYDNENSTATQILGHAVNRLEPLSEYDPQLGEIALLLNEAAIQVDEAANRLHHYLDRLELDPQRLEWLEERLGTIHDLARKHRVMAEELPGVLIQCRTELADIEDAETNLDRLSGELAALEREYAELATQVSAARQQSAQRLSAEVTARMQELGMPGGRFEAAITSLDAGNRTAYGLDRVEFLVSANPGQPGKPLTKVASGGELSRISLALQVVTASVGRVPTLIFDEVDVGIGGRVAEIVGQRLRSLGTSRQVLCITHLAQVAAQGQHHLQVNKRNSPEVEVTIRPLAETERVQEIARMIGGVTITEQTRAHAEEMLGMAENQ